jgi:hypothetical protein
MIRPGKSQDRRILPDPASHPEAAVSHLVETHRVSRELAAYVHDLLSRRSPLGASQKPVRVAFN